MGTHIHTSYVFTSNLYGFAALDRGSSYVLVKSTPAVLYFPNAPISEEAPARANQPARASTWAVSTVPTLNAPYSFCSTRPGAYLGLPLCT